MSEEEMIEKAAVHWVGLGGDATGLQFCFRELLKKIDEITEGEK